MKVLGSWRMLQARSTLFEVKRIPVFQCVRLFLQRRHNPIGVFWGTVQTIRESIRFWLIAIIRADEDLSKPPMIVGNQVGDSPAVDTGLLDCTDLHKVRKCGGTCISAICINVGRNPSTHLDNWATACIDFTIAANLSTALTDSGSKSMP